MRSYRTGTIWPLLLVLLAPILLHVSRPALAEAVRQQRAPAAVSSAVTVTTAALSPTSFGDPNDGACDLREAMQAIFTANSQGQATQFNECQASPGAATITFAANVAGQTITLAHGDDTLPFVNYDLTILGPITLSGGGLPPSNPPPGNENWDSRLFHTVSGGTLSLVNLTVRDTFTVGSGGVILGGNNSTINLVGVSMMDNTVYGDGGAINTNGNLNILLSSFSNNVALGRNANDYSNNEGTGFGGALFVSGPYNLTVSLSNFSGNTANKSGGAIAINQSVTADISDTNFAGNVAQADTSGTAGGGALYNYDSHVTITRSPFNGNVTTNGSGGAIFNNLGADHLAISDSSFNGNVSGDTDTAGRGGALYTEEDMSITRSTFNANVVLGSGLGGAITNNRAAVLQISNSTFLANAIVDGLNAAGQGGAIANIDTPYPVSSQSTVDLRNVTLTDNKAQTGGAIYNEERVRLWNTIVDEGIIGGGGTCAGAAPQNMGHNLQNPGTDCGAGIDSQDPDLAAPTFNGGALATLLSRLPNDGSPAVDAGDNAVCAGPQVNNEDQRGSARPKDGDGAGGETCDIGATEAGTAAPGFGSDPVQPGPLDFGNATPGEPVTFNLLIIETGSRELIVGGSLGGPDAADFSISTPLPLALADGAPQFPLALVCQPASATPGPRSATLTLTTNDPDHAQVTYDLLCNVPAVATPGFGATPDEPGPVDFGATPVGSPVNATLTLRETGNTQLLLGPYTLIGPHAADFALGATIPSINDGAGDVPFSLTCTPSETGLRTAQLLIGTNDPARPTAEFNLVCQGTAVQPSPLPTPGQALLTGLSAGAAGPYGVAVSPDSRFVYVTDYGDDLVVAFERNNLGGLELLAVYENGVGGVANMIQPVFITLSPDGRNVYVAASGSDAVVAFSRDVASGELTYLSAVVEGNGYGCFPLPCSGFVDGLDGAYGVVVSPDGRYVYVTGINDDALVVLRRNTSTGELRSFLTGANFVQTFASVHLDGVRGVAISPDGLHLYTASYLVDKLTVFSRSPNTGQVTFVETRRDGDLINVNPPRFLDGLDGATHVALSPDGAYLYVTGQSDNAIAVFRRNALTGGTTFLRSYDDDTGSGDGLGGAFGLALSPDGRTLYATGFSDDSVAVFERDKTSGLLTHRQTALQPELDGAVAVAAAADGNAIYVAGYNQNRIVTLRRANPAPQIDALLPASAAGGSGDLLLSIHGQGFLPGSRVRWNGVDRAVTYVSPTELRIDVSAADLPADVSVTSAAVQVINLTPGGGAAAAAFAITHGAELPIPSIASVSPQSLPAGAPSATLTVYGANFLPAVQVLWNGSAWPTTYVSGTELRFTLSAADLLDPGAAAISLVNQTREPLSVSREPLSVSRDPLSVSREPLSVSRDPYAMTDNGLRITDYGLRITDYGLR
ncbi:MAG: beta-propeller fold lactonase family protein, partial [Anaerolineales bacterium]|nr:beta-propeller fold lactonase family protein [Anaerolineales bacterium]